MQLSARFMLMLIAAILLVLGVGFLRRLPAIRRVSEFGGDWLALVVPMFFALSTFMAGAILLFSGATPARAGRMGWVNDILPLPIVEASAYFASLAGVGLIILARGLQRRLDAAYHLTEWLLAGSIVFAIMSAFDVEQAVVLSLMLALLIPSRRFFDRKASILQERFTPGWIAAIAVVLVGTVALVIAAYGRNGIDTGVFWRFGQEAQGPRAVRGLALVAAAIVAYGVARLIRPARATVVVAQAEDLAAAELIVARSPRASAHLALLGDKSLLFNKTRSAFIMYGVAGQSWVSLGDPVGELRASVELIEDFITRADHAGDWPVFYRVSPPFLHLYLEYALAVVKLGEIARVSLQGFSLEGPTRRNLRRVSRKAVDDGCYFEMVNRAEAESVLPDLREVSAAWLAAKRTKEKSFSLGCFAEDFVRRFPIGVVRRDHRIVAFVTLWPSGQHAEVEVDLMRYTADAPPGIMRFALIQSMLWAKEQGYSWFNLGGAPLSGLRTSAVMPVWNQIGRAVRGAGERYYNFQGVREFKEWFYPEWEPTYLVSPGGVKRPFILTNIASLISRGGSRRT